VVIGTSPRAYPFLALGVSQTNPNHQSLAIALPWLTRSNALTLAGILAGFGLIWSRTAISIGAVIAVLCAVAHPNWRVWLEQIRRNPISWLPLVFFGLAVASHLTSDNWASSYPKLVTRLPIPLFVLGFAATGRLTAVQRRWVAWVFILSVSAMALYMVVQVLLDYPTYTALLARGKAVPTPNGILPLSFGLMSAFAVFLAVYMARSVELEARFDQVIAWLCAGVLLLSLHLLANRTGLLCLYGSAALIGCVFAFQAKYRKQVWLGGALLSLVVALGWIALPTLREKLRHGLADIAHFRAGDNLDDWSIGPRLAAADATWQVFLEHPVFGAGLGDVNQAVQDQYLSSSYRLRPENRIGPHNQWLETLAGQGLVGFCSLAAMIWYPLCVKRYRNQVVVLAQIGCTTLGMLTDSTLEVQLGLNFFAFFGFFTLTQYGPGAAESKPAVEIHPHQPVR
jgi:O-antigen ligase